MKFNSNTHVVDTRFLCNLHWAYQVLHPLPQDPWRLIVSGFQLKAVVWLTVYHDTMYYSQPVDW